MAEVRQAVWDVRIALLRRIDPDNPHLTYFANPNSPPRQEALDRLDAAIEAASIKRVADKIMPNGRLIGRRGGGLDVRELPGGTKAARDLFDYLRVGGTEHRSTPNMTIIKVPGDAGFLTFRQPSGSGDTAIDVNVPRVRLKLYFPENTINIQELVDGYLEESKIDYVGLWQIAQASREELGAGTTDQVRKLSLEIVKRLYDNGLRPGNYWGGDFDYWPDEGCQAVLDRIEREWTAAGEDPNLGDPICWFAPRPS